MRGKDQNQRKPRGPPTNKSKEIRSNSVIESNKKADRKGYQTLFPSQQTSQFASNITQNVAVASVAGMIQSRNDLML